MYSYLTGEVVIINSTYIVIDNNNIGYQIYTANPYSFELNQEYTVYLYQHVRENELTLYGFKTKTEKELFLNLIKVKRLGPKMILPMLATGCLTEIKTAIKIGDINYLKKFPKIGDKLAYQIILDLKGKLDFNDKEKPKPEQELSEILKSLGYKRQCIEQVIKNIDFKVPIEEQVKIALKLLLK